MRTAHEDAPLRGSRRRISKALLILISSAVGPVAVLGLAELWVRVTLPYIDEQISWVFVPEVGRMIQPRSLVRATDRRDFWTVTRSNRWGFLDREPPPPQRAAASCHVALIGDSFVAAREVAIADKVQVRLETLARRSLPHLDITVSAFGIGNTGQINQLPLYDAYARRLHPKLVVLFVNGNDFGDNVQWRRVIGGHDPYRLPWLSVARAADGAFKFIPPTADYQEGAIPWRRSFWQQPLRHVRPLTKQSAFYRWASYRSGRALSEREQDEYVETLKQRGHPRPDNSRLSAMGFALDEFKARAARDGAALVAFANHSLNGLGGMPFDSLHVLAEPRDIPIVDQFEHIVRRGGNPDDAKFPFDLHWNPTGHLWAAEALLEWLLRHQQVCATRQRSAADAWASESVDGRADSMYSSADAESDPPALAPRARAPVE